MQEGRYAVACPKLEESLRLQYGLGTEFNLADCNENVGKLAAAWLGFTSVADAARTQNQPQREAVARDRAKALEPRVSMVTIEVPEPAILGLELVRDGIAIGGGAGTAPIDPGPHQLTASAPGRQTWHGTFTAAPGTRLKLIVPPLAPLAQAPVAAAPIVPARPVVAERAAPAKTTSAESSSTYFPEPVVDRGRGQRIAGWIVGAAGLAGLGVAAGFGVDSIQNAERSKRYCDGNLCSDQGVSLRERAIRSGDVATVAAVAGATTVLGGLALILTAPGSSSPSQDKTGSIRAVPSVANSGGGLTIQGLLP